MSREELNKETEQRKKEEMEMRQLFQRLDEELSEITVSEKLIQKTLGAVEAKAATDKTERSEAGKAPKEQNKTGKRKSMAWLGTLAAAAVLGIIYLGGNLGRLRLTKEEAMDNAAPNYSAELSGGEMPQEATASSDSSTAATGSGNTGAYGVMDSDGSESGECFESTQNVPKGESTDDKTSVAENMTGDAAEEMESAVLTPLPEAEMPALEAAPLQEILQLCDIAGEVAEAQWQSASEDSGIALQIVGTLTDGCAVECVVYTNRSVELMVELPSGGKQQMLLGSRNAEAVLEILGMD
ncbi:MAG: hypothetical protein IJY09_00085 [Lachnospiraceae bacterium]|nr:hypothetical protein [Lachnospiraceae bacterium]